MSQAPPESSITVKLFGNQVTFTFPSPHSTLITIPPGSAWEPGPHWHEAYVENVRVVQGRAWVSVNGVVREVGVGEGSVRFGLRDVHTFGRADRGRKGEPGADAGDVVIEECTEPDDGFKHVFFYNVLRTVQTSSLARPSTILQLMRTVAHVDNYVDLLPFLGSSWWLPFSLKYALVHAVYGLGSAFAGALGYPKWSREFTPRELWGVAERGAVKESEAGRRRKIP
ncbi:uncharacterized protein A1O9_01043 [Exophiala aquamarina CBS 119918]|uniref:Cupin 2 conserved barrel domain-containing protein n=1 Tax=Exophiala aquamarina CBS 119918 TaxID=1182545 RepID=A0A072PTI1_9EURO|nr:uncharacterized protein A1O9_01043 [Exophiala aquamarina CBS 119918]KEF63067.1 hypothetical protein A1O9_01043 [Exophiala aquamarina CBS 119918]